MATMENALTCNEYWEERLRTIMECACHCLNVRETTGFRFRESFQRMQWNEKMKILEGLNGLFVGVEGSEKNAVAETEERTDKFWDDDVSSSASLVQLSKLVATKMADPSTHDFYDFWKLSTQP
ncbi:Uncharacterized protein Fot_51891 [Forsythia ovata]|uniref:Uncharacterized protein n=1 Tax=Forsythia ovata TaxID=205694 RepID=A0ABD1PWP6_9LAMI